jgi:hypothetical protein
MNYNLFINYWSSSDTNRNKEVLDTIESNLKTNIFDKITIFTEIDSVKDLNKFKNKCEIIVESRRMYQDIFDYCNTFFSSTTDINVLANSDIEFDETIKLLNHITENDFIALTRYNRPDNKIQESALKGNISDSQDVWCWKGKIRLIGCNYYLGIPGCDNKIAFNAFDQGYDVRNPSLSVITYHNHTTDSRTGTSKILNMRLERPYCFLKTTKLNEEYVIITEELKTIPKLFLIKENEWKLLKEKI